MFGRFRTWETLLLLAAGALLVVGVARAFDLGLAWTLGLATAFFLFAYVPLALRLQDWLLERSLARGDFDRGLRIASTIRDSTRTGVARDLAEFDVGLVHLARGAPVDAQRAFARIESRRLKPRARLFVQLYRALADLRVEPANRAAAEALVTAADEAMRETEEEPTSLAAKAEGVLALGRAADARTLLARSLELDPDPTDPSPGERHVLLARAALQAGERDEAARALRVAASLAVDAPFVRAARAELAQLESAPT